MVFLLFALAQDITRVAPGWKIEVVAQDGKRAELYGGGILRMRPDATGLEVYSTGTRNHLDVAINAEDELFTYDNTDEKNGWWSRVTHMVDGGHYGYPYEWKPARPWILPAMTDYGHGAPTAGFAYEEDAIPALRGHLILADFGKRQIHDLAIERAGATWRVAAKNDLAVDPPPGFRPVGLALAPDGVLRASIADPAVRMQAVRRLGTERLAVEPALLKDPDPAMRFKAATALGRAGGTVAPLAAALEDSDPFVRFASWTALRRIGLADATLWPEIARGLQSPSAAVRQGTVFALREVHDVRVVEALPKTPEAVEVLESLVYRAPEWKGEWWAYHPFSSPPPARTREWEGTKAALRALSSEPAVLLRIKPTRELCAGFLDGPMVEEAAVAAARIGAVDLVLARVRRAPAPAGVLQILAHAKPEGLQAGMSLQGFADLVAYLESLK